MPPVVAAHPDVLGIGIDTKAAVVVKGDRMGSPRHEQGQPFMSTGKPYYFLSRATGSTWKRASWINAILSFTTQNVTVYRGDKMACDGITLSIHAGEHVAILGPNGCGKSTLIKTITRECYPRYSGDGIGLRIFGQETWNVFDLRALLGIVSNDLMQSCTRDISGREVVLSGFFSSIGIWPNHHVTQAMEARADEILELLEIGRLAERDVNEMSTGEARRILIGRALAHNPKALVLDEPTASLDLHAMHELRTILGKACRGRHEHDRRDASSAGSDSGYRPRDSDEAGADPEGRGEAGRVDDGAAVGPVSNAGRADGAGRIVSALVDSAPPAHL